MMLSLVESTPSTAPGVRAPDPARRAPHLLKNQHLAWLAGQIHQLYQRSHEPPTRCPSGWSQLDAALGGGFVMAAIHELVVMREGTPAYSVALKLAARAAGLNRSIVYIDTWQDLYPPGAAQLGVPLDRLLVVRPFRRADALWVCERTLRCRAVAAVVLPLRTIDAYASRRLQVAAEAGGGLGLIIRSTQTGGPTFAASRLRLDPLVGPGGIRQVLVTVLKLREGWLCSTDSKPASQFVVELSDGADSLSAHAALADRPCPPRLFVGQ